MLEYFDVRLFEVSTTNNKNARNSPESDKERLGDELTSLPSTTLPAGNATFGRGRGEGHQWPHHAQPNPYELRDGDMCLHIITFLVESPREW